MRRIIAIVSALILTTTFIVGCGEKEKSKKEVKGFFYEVEKEGKKLYLGGSVHTCEKDREYVFSEDLNKAFESSDVLALELDFNNISSSDAIFNNIEYGNDDKLSNHISNDAKEHLEEILNELGIPFDNLEKTQLWYLPMYISQIQSSKLGYDSKMSIDYTFLREANKTDKTVIGLETLEDQIKVMEILAEQSDDKLNKAVLQIPNLEGQDVALKELIKCIADGEDNKLYELEKLSQSTSDEKYYNAMVVYRNKKFYNSIEKFINEDKTYFVCVGALHLVGENGIVEMLKNDGYEVTRIE